MMGEPMDEGFVRSEWKAPGRRVWSVAPGAVAPAALLVFLDAELYLQRVAAAQAVRDLVDHGAIPPVATVYVSHGDAAARHTDFVCDDAYAHFLAEALLPFARHRVPAAASERVVLVGLSLSGLAAGHAALTAGRFRAAVCQSPSFWWDGERFAASLDPAGDGAAAFWISVGDLETESGVSHPPSGLRQETSQLDSCRRGAEALRAAGHTVSHRIFAGGHDPACWKKDLALALPWALSV
jgi:enterochelin esterase family protein